MKNTSIGLTDLEYNLIKWYSEKKKEKVSRMAARLILAEADIYAHQDEALLKEWAGLAGQGAEKEE